MGAAHAMAHGMTHDPADQLPLPPPVPAAAGSGGGRGSWSAGPWGVR